LRRVKKRNVYSNSLDRRSYEAIGTGQSAVNMGFKMAMTILVQGLELSRGGRNSLFQIDKS
jgi:hypothetical protein